MRKKILTADEIEKIQVIVKELLKPINGTVVFGKPTIIHCSMSDGGEHRSEWDEPWYKITVNTNKGVHQYSDAFRETSSLLDLVRFAWGISWSTFNKVDGNLHSSLGENLWPSNNNYTPDFDKYVEMVQE